MNARRVHELMRAHFPATGTGRLEWTNLVDERGLLIEDRAKVVLLDQYVKRNVTEVLVEVHRKLGDRLPVNEVVSYLQSHVGQGEIRISDREFTMFAVMAINGVGVSWRTAL
nr:hypothetical protein [Variovorax paradoxus]